jgi:(p)ppGpp synthase/HD superfamily hydrolase
MSASRRHGMEAANDRAMSEPLAAEISDRSSLWQRAADIAAEAHLGQTTPGRATPYVAHPARVAMLVATVFRCDDPEVLAAALLHDVLEKTAVDRAGLALAMGSKVAGWVEWLSKDPAGDKGAYWRGLAAAPWQARMIKMADALDHLNGPPEYLADRLKVARKALALATTPEPELQRAGDVLEQAIDALSRERPD